eukprot:TRINITY_DN43571_c0_g1_i1.p1 TRINITY_DN43571_c0_g1~~TRINITY_DN43571_c0_g1_i1.p1  ORF type:complete len:344 (-),score=45.11 TRINITY_DN43571_c0_g1_i1:134-1165(-)
MTAASRRGALRRLLRPIFDSAVSSPAFVVLRGCPCARASSTASLSASASAAMGQGSRAVRHRGVDDPKGSLRGKYFTKTHEWFLDEGDGIGTIGITQVAQRGLGEVVFCRLPREGERFRVMETLATLEAVKTVGEVKCPVAGEVLEVNQRLELEPALVTRSPLSDGWLVRIAFDYLPNYLRRSRAITRDEIGPLLADFEQFQEFLRTRLGEPGASIDEAAVSAEAAESDASRELVFDGLFSKERRFVHEVAEELGFAAHSRGRGPGRQIVVRCQASQNENQAKEEGEEITMAVREDEPSSTPARTVEKPFGDDPEREFEFETVPRRQRRGGRRRSFSDASPTQ